MGKIKIKKEDLEKLVSKGLKDSEIAKILNVKPISIYFARKRCNIQRESYSEANNIEISEKQKEFFIGCVLGDGSLIIDNKCINPRFSCEHGMKQEDYIKWKFDVIKNLNGFIRYSKRKTPDKRNGICYESIVIRTNANKALLPLYNMLYNEDKIKLITEDCLKFYTPFAMAVHYMDDGCITSNGYRINTHCFDKHSLNKLQLKFKEYGIETSIQKHNIIYIKANSRALFTNLIEEYFPQSMKYKLHRV